jgi:hypothetical protein
MFNKYVLNFDIIPKYILIYKIAPLANTYCSQTSTCNANSFLSRDLKINKMNTPELSVIYCYKLCVWQQPKDTSLLPHLNRITYASSELFKDNKTHNDFRFEMLTVVTAQITVIWEVAPCKSVSLCWCFERRTTCVFRITSKPYVE